MVAKQLETLGYPIFYRNFKVFYNRYHLSEFDIVSDGFIVEVKSGRDYKTKGLSFMYSYGLLPSEFKYYIYCPVLSDEEIAALNHCFPRQHILYINSYQKIIENHMPCRDVHITSECIFANFLNLTMEHINKFGTLFIKPADYFKMVHRVTYERDRYSYKDNMKWSEKITYLMKCGRIVLTDTPPPHVRPMIKAIKPYFSKKLTVLEQFSIPLIYYINIMKKDHTMTDIYHPRR